MSAESATPLLQDYCSLCDALYQFLLEENSALRAPKVAFSEAYLAQKRDFVGRAKASAEALQGLNSHPNRLKTPQQRELVAQTKARLMQIFLLNQENEQLLLKHNWVQARDWQRGQAGQRELQGAYAQSALASASISVRP